MSEISEQDIARLKFLDEIRKESMSRVVARYELPNNELGRGEVTVVSREIESWKDEAIIRFRLNHKDYEVRVPIDRDLVADKHQALGLLLHEMAKEIAATLVSPMILAERKR